MQDAVSTILLLRLITCGLVGGGGHDSVRVHDNKVAMNFGVYVGLFVAEGTDRLAEFCGIAENALKEQKPISRFWIATNQNSNPTKP